LVEYCFKHNEHERYSFKLLREEIQSILKRRESKQPEQPVVQSAMSSLDGEIFNGQKAKQEDISIKILSNYTKTQKFVQQYNGAKASMKSTHINISSNCLSVCLSINK